MGDVLAVSPGASAPELEAHVTGWSRATSPPGTATAPGLGRAGYYTARFGAGHGGVRRDGSATVAAPGSRAAGGEHTRSTPLTRWRPEVTVDRLLAVRLQVHRPHAATAFGGLSPVAIRLSAWRRRKPATACAGLGLDLILHVKIIRKSERPVDFHQPPSCNSSVPPPPRYRCTRRRRWEARCRRETWTCTSTPGRRPVATPPTSGCWS
jgi:hypothetical protein